MSAARAAARNKPVLVVKAGPLGTGPAAAASHTGALAGSDLVFDAAIRRAGMLRVDTLQELFMAAETLARWRDNRAQRLNGDHRDQRRRRRRDGRRRSGRLRRAGTGATAARARSRLDVRSAGELVGRNPVDIIGDAPVERYVRTFEALLDRARRPGTLLFVHAPTAIVPATDIARALVPVAAGRPRPRGRLLAGRPGRGRGAQVFHAAGIACLRHARAGRAGLRDAGHLPAQPGAC
jgi:acetyltransferase